MEIVTMLNKSTPADAVEWTIHREQQWCVIPGDIFPSSGSPRISAGRWKGQTQNEREENSVIETNCHVIAIALRPMNITFFAENKIVHDGHLQQGAVSVNRPGLRVRGIFRGGYDELHLRVPNTIMAACIKAGGKQYQHGSVFGAVTVDPIVARLAQAFIHAEELGGAFCQTYAEGIGLAIIAQLFGRTSPGSSPAEGSRVAPLLKWRLRRATDYIAAHLGDSIGLADIAASAGLTRMHFAAQFRAATGLRPHEYVLWQRVERAQQLLVTGHMPLAEIAFEVGFKAQSHFTSVFSRLVGQTPYVWRQQNRLERSKPQTPAANRDQY
jgi:AraC-like DNA-binding protein